MRVAVALVLCGLALLLIPVSAAGAATLSGTVRAQLVGQEAKAQPGVTVTVLDHITGEGIASTVTDSSGAYSVATPPRTVDVHFDPPAESGAGPTTISGIDLSKDATVNVVLVPGEAARFQGSVRTATGDPVPGLRLYFDSSNPEVAAETDSEGNFSVLLSPGSYRFVIEYLGEAKAGVPAGFWEWDLKTLTLEKDRSAEIVLPKTSQLTVHVTGSEGAPIPEAGVDVGPLSAPQNLGGLGTGSLFQSEFSRKTDAEGDIHATVFNGWSGKGTVRPPQSSGYGNTPFAIPAVEGDTTLAVKAQPALTFKGSVRTATGDPVPGLRLYFDSSNPEVAAETDSEGNFSVLLSPGSYRFVIEYLGEAKAGVPAGFWEWDLKTLTLEKDRSAEIVLPKTSQLTVHVTGSEGAPIPEAGVDVGPLSAPQNLGGLGTGSLFQSEFSRKTDAEGDIHATVFNGWSGKGTVRPPQSSGYGNTPFAIPAVEGDTTLAVSFSAGEEPEDSQPPQLHSLTIEPTEIDTTSSDQFVTVTAHLSDDLAGLESGAANLITLVSPEGNQETYATLTRVSGSDLDGTFEGILTFRRFCQAGTWDVKSLRLEDRAGHRVTFGAGQLQELGFPHTVQVKDKKEDTQAPQLQSLAIEPGSIHSGSKEFVTVIAHLTDNLAGLDTGAVNMATFYPPEGEGEARATLTRVSGTDSDGTFEAILPAGYFGRTGTWPLNLRITDRVGNYATFDAEQLQKLGFPSSVQVLEGGEEEPKDTTPPQIDELSFEPGEIDTSASAQTVFVTAHVTDAGSGFAKGEISFTSPSGESFTGGGFERISGTAANGTYRTKVPFERFSEVGSWGATVVLADAAGNSADLNPGELQEAGLPHAVQVTSSPPAVTAVSPSSGTEAGGTAVQILGSGFSGASAVRFGTAEATEFSVESPGSIIAVAPPGTGAVDVTVTTPAGTSAIGAADVFTYSPPVTLSSSPNPSVRGQKVTFTAKVMPIAPGAPTPLGTVAFVEGTTTLGVVNLSKGTATFNTTALGAGKHPVVARYSGDSRYGPGESEPLTQVVEKANTQLTLTSSLNPAPFSSAATLKATVKAIAPGAGSPAGTVTFREGEAVLATVQLSGANATYSLKAMAVGSHEITATYNGDPDFEPSVAAPLTQTIVRAKTETTLVSTLNPAPYGSSATLKATVKAVAPATGTPPGTVTFREGSTVLAIVPLSGSVAKLALKSFVPGSHEITATYSGDPGYEPSEAGITQAITVASTELNLTSSKNPAPFGSSGNLKATVKAVAPGGGTPAGSVTFREGETVLATIPLSSSSVTYPLKSLAVGTHEITASYSGSGNYEQSESTLTQVINP
jgi:hypothetical protein